MTIGNSSVSYNMASGVDTEKPSMVQGVAGAPNETALLALMERTGFQMIQENGQRKYGGPPPGWDGPPPARGCEVFIGKIPRDCYEDELVPVFEKMGDVYEFRLMMDFSGSNRGYAFVMYTRKGPAQRAVRELNNYEIRKGRFLGVCLSVDNCRLFVGGIPKNKQRDEILQEMVKITEGVVDVIVYPSATDKAKNRGFAFVEYESHRAAAMARRKLIPGRIQLWGHQIAVDWAEPEQEVDDDVMSKVKILYVRNLMLTTTEEAIKATFETAANTPGCVERVKKIRDYAFVHFMEREQALHAMQVTNGSSLEGSMIEVCLAKPVDKNEYVRYTRNVGRGVMPTVNTAVLTGMPGYEFPYMPQGLYSPLSPTAVTSVTPTATSPKSQFGVRGPMRGRGRGAAGSRGAGNRGGYIPGYMRNQYRRMTSELLEEICHKNGWGSAVFQLHSAMGAAGDQLFLFKVTIPALSSTGFAPNKLCRTVDEAKEYASQYVLAQLGFPVAEGGDTMTPAVASVMTTPPTSLFQGRPIGPAYPALNGAPIAHTDLTLATSVQMPALAASPPSYVMAASKVPAMTPPIQTMADLYGYELAQFPTFQSAAAAAALSSAIPTYQAF